MVATATRERIVLEMMLRVPKEVPDVSFASGIDIEALTQPDTNEGREPFFITLPLGEKDQKSHNGRYYMGDVAINAIEKAITQNKIGGNKGHTPSAERGTHFDVPVLHWVGAIIQDGIAWGKAYVPGDSERMREMRGYYKRLKALGGNAGTSLEGMGLQNWNPEIEMYEISELDISRIDAVEALGVGVDIAGSKSPHITTELKEAVQPGELSVGDLVSWDDNGALIRGQVNTIWEDGEVEVPYSDSPPLEATSENPIARMDVYEPTYSTGDWVLSHYQVVRFFSQITKIERLPEMNSQAKIGESKEDDEIEEADSNIQEDKMAEVKDAPKSEDRIAELTQQHETEVTSLTGQLQEAQRELRPLKASETSLREALSLDTEADVVEAVKNLMKERDSLAGENSVLLETAIQAEVAEKAKIIGEALDSKTSTTITFGKTVQRLIAADIQSEKISRYTDIQPAIEKVFSNDSTKSLLESLKIAVMGPNVTAQDGVGDETDEKLEAVTY